MKNRITYPTILILLALIFTSCGDDFLDQPPKASLTAGSFPTSESDAILATNAIYNSLRAWQINTGGFPLLDMMADDAVKGSNPSDGNAIKVYDNFQYTALEGSTERWYKTLYQAVRRANLVITEVPLIDMDETLKDRLIGEARFLRAYFYGQLVRGFGAVPLVTEVDPPLGLSRTDGEQIFMNLIVPDLEFAAQVLPEKSDYPDSELGRATRGAAKALLARLYLYYGDFTNVEKYTMEVINSGQYDLEPTFDRAFSYQYENGIESVFEVSAKPLNTGEGGNQYGNTQGIRGTPNRGWGFCRPAYGFIEELQDLQDPRLDHTVIFLGEVLAGVPTVGDASTPDTIYENGSIKEIECYNQKVWYPGTTSELSFGTNRRIIRYADVMLMAAEALNENGKSEQARQLLNEIRTRAREGNAGILPNVETTNQATLRDAIWKERKHELAIEGLRFWDLVRTDRAEAILGPLGFVKGKNELFPIPQSEIDISEGTITQNPGY
jgi:hypothetical protein